MSRPPRAERKARFSFGTDHDAKTHRGERTSMYADFWWPLLDLNQQPLDYRSSALAK